MVLYLIGFVGHDRGKGHLGEKYIYIHRVFAQKFYWKIQYIISSEIANADRARILQCLRRSYLKKDLANPLIHTRQGYTSTGVTNDIGRRVMFDCQESTYFAIQTAIFSIIILIGKANLSTRKIDKRLLHPSLKCSMPMLMY